MALNDLINISPMGMNSGGIIRTPIGINPVPIGPPPIPVTINEEINKLSGMSAISNSDLQVLGSKVLQENRKVNNILSNPVGTFNNNFANVNVGLPNQNNPSYDDIIGYGGYFSDPNNIRIPQSDPFIEPNPEDDIRNTGGGLGRPIDPTSGNGSSRNTGRNSGNGYGTPYGRIPIPIDPNAGSGKPPTPPPPPPPPTPKPDPNNYIPSGAKIMSRFDPNYDILKDKVQIQTTGLWSNGSGSLSSFHTGSNSATQKTYFYSIYNGDPTSCAYGKQFDVSYGHYYGSGSVNSGGQVEDTSTRAIYSQMKLTCLDDPTVENKFEFTSGSPKDHSYFVLFNVDKMKDRVDPGNWELNLSELNGSAHPNQFFTGSNVQVSSSNKVIRLIDDSGDTDESIAVETAYLTSRTYNVVSGSISDGVYSTTSRGKFYPDLGVIALDADYLNSELSFNTVTGSNIAGDNAYKLFTSISGSAVINSDYTFDARNTRVLTNEYFFVRIKSKEYNYSNNPTFVTGSLGEFRYRSYEHNPKTYITTIGLYNDKRECLAIAKTSQPIENSFNEEHLIRVKIEI